MKGSLNITAQVLIFSIGIPFLFLGLLEGGARLIDLPAQVASPSQGVLLEMPAWFTNEENTKRRAKTIAADPSQTSWMSLFQEGRGFRVHLIPNIEGEAENPFSLIPHPSETSYFVKANGLGFRGPAPRRDPPPNNFRIALFGDSSTFGWGVSEDEIFSALLPSLLSELDPSRDYEVLNFGVPGDSSEYGRLVAERFIPELKPDLILLGFGANDARLVYTPHTVQVERFRRTSLLVGLRSLLQSSSLFRSMELLLAPEAPRPTERVAAVTERRFSNNLRAMSNLGEKHGSRGTLFLSACTPGHYASRVRSVAERQSMPFLNAQTKLRTLLPELQEGLLYPDYVASMKERYGDTLTSDPLAYVTSDRCHPNRLGHRIIADSIATKLIDLIHTNRATKEGHGDIEFTVKKSV